MSENSEICKPFTQSLLELPKWKLALIGAVPVAAIGLGFWYFSGCNKRSDNASDSKGKRKAGKTQTNEPPQPQVRHYLNPPPVYIVHAVAVITGAGTPLRIVSLFRLISYFIETRKK